MAHGQELNLTLKVWRQKNSKAIGSFETHRLNKNLTQRYKK